MYCDWPTLGRCCFCMPLRRGILTFGYINLFFCAFLVGIYSYSIHSEFGIYPLYHGSGLLPVELCLVLYCLELIFNAVLIYGVHMKIVSYVRIYYYFTLTTIVASLLIQIVDIVAMMTNSRGGLSVVFEFGPLVFASLFIQVYLIILVKSLLRRMETSSAPNVYDNPLQQFVYEGRVDTNGIYDSTVVPVEV